MRRKKALEGKAVYPTLDDNKLQDLIIWCDESIDKVSNGSITNDRIDFKHMAAALFFKTMLYTGIT